MKLKKYINRKGLIFVICILLFVLMGFLIFNFYTIYEVASHDYKADVLDSMSNRINSLFLEINDFPRDEGDDVLYLGKLRSLNNFINSEGNTQSVLRGYLEDDFMSFMEVNEVYHQLRYINEEGYEIIRAEFNGEEYFIVEDDEFHYKGDMYYFDYAMKLEEDQIYVSRLDLNVEDGELENRGIIENPIYVPIIRYAIPVFDNGGVRRGILVLNVYADYFLEDIRRLVKDDEVSFLVNNEGYYLAHPNRTKEFSFMFDSDYKMSRDYGQGVSDAIIGNFDLRNYEDDDHVFTFRHLYPTIGTFAMYQGAESALGENAHEEYYWVLVSVSDKDEIDKSVDTIQSKFIVLAVISALMLVLIFILLLIILVLNEKMR